MGENDIDMKAIERDIHAQYTDALTQLQSDLDAVTAERDAALRAIRFTVGHCERCLGIGESQQTHDAIKAIRNQLQGALVLTVTNAFAAGVGTPPTRNVQPILDLLEKHPGPWEAKYTGDMTPFLDGKRAHVKKDALLNAINAFAAGFEAGEVAGG